MSLPGRLVIFNHQEFQSNESAKRLGTEYDVEALQETFGKYNVPSKVFHNFTKQQVINEMEKIEKINFRDKSCLVIAILSHGGPNDTILACGANENEEFYSIQQEIINKITRNPTLRDKPKIIIVQACKGEEEIQRNQPHLDSAPADVKKSEILLHAHPDELYKFYSTTESFVSYRQSTGSCFIQTFCKIFDKLGHEDDIKKIMSLTYSEVKKISKGTQFPSQTYTGGDKPYVFGNFATSAIK